MAWLAINKKDNSEWISERLPIYENEEWWPYFELIPDGNIIELPQGTIEKILGYKLTFENSPVEIR